MGTLTVRENLAFSANLRLDAKKFSVQSRKESVNHVLKLLGLESCADSRVNTEELLHYLLDANRKALFVSLVLYFTKFDVEECCQQALYQLSPCLCTWSRTFSFLLLYFCSQLPINFEPCTV